MSVREPFLAVGHVHQLYTLTLIGIAVGHLWQLPTG